MTRKIIISLISSILFMLIISLVYYKIEVNLASAENGKNFIFTVRQGEKVKEISANLKKAGLIKSTLIFEIYTWLYHRQTLIMPGEYSLNSSSNIKKIVEIITSGEISNYENTVKIIEGWRINDINDYLIKNDLPAGKAFNTLARGSVSPWKFTFSKPDFLKDAPANATLEGFLFPDTYRLFKNATAGGLIKKMLDNFGNKFDDRMKRDVAVSRGKTIFQVVILASLIEKEVKTPEDMKIVSGILWHRLENSQPLQLDATLSYVLGDSKSTHDFNELAVDSPYNTYKYRGLSPGPICNPSLNAIKAAIYPKYSDFNYFLTKPSGEVVYSKTLAEHVKNKEKFLR